MPFSRIENNTPIAKIRNAVANAYIHVREAVPSARLINAVLNAKVFNQIPNARLEFAPPPGPTGVSPRYMLLLALTSE